jgi:putative transposase
VGVGRGKKISVVLSPEEERTLRMWARAGTTEQRLAQRARAILASAEGLPLPEVSRLSGISVQNCSEWRRRFLVERLQGLTDRPRSGRPAEISVEKRIELQRLACEKRSDGATRWTVRALAKKTGLSPTTVHRFLNEGDLKPHKVEQWCGKSPDPEFEAKQAAIIGLYLDPPENALVLAVDEKSQIQALDRTQPELPMRSGQPRRQTATYKRNGTTCLLAALSVHEGTIDARCVDRNTHREFLAFLKHLYRQNPGVHLHVIVDNLSVHKHAEVQAWVKRRRRLTLHFTPTYASWLNQVEIWFNIFTRAVLKGGVWPSKQTLVKQIMTYIRTYNEEHAAPFQWTYAGKRDVA